MGRSGFMAEVRSDRAWGLQGIWLGHKEDLPSFGSWLLPTGRYPEEAYGKWTLLWTH